MFGPRLNKNSLARATQTSIKLQCHCFNEMRLSDTEKFLHFYRFLYRQFDEVNYFTVLSTAEREADQASSGCGIVLVTKDHKGSCQKRTPPVR